VVGAIYFCWARGGPTVPVRNEVARKLKKPQSKNKDERICLICLPFFKITFLASIQQKETAQRPGTERQVNQHFCMSLKNELMGDKEGVYKKLALDFNGEFSIGEFENPIRVNIPHKNWIITVDTFVTIELISVSKGNPYGGNSEYTRIRVPFLKLDNLNFAITTTTLIDSLTKLFGAQDISVGEHEFDRIFTIKGTDPTKIQLLLSNSSIRQMILELKEVNLLLRDQEGLLGTRLPDGVSELCFKSSDVIFDNQELTHMVNLFRIMLDELLNIGCAKVDSPNFKLV
jgi:hypothetical protein